MSAINEIWNNISYLIPGLNTSNTGIVRRITEACGSVIDTVRLEMLRSEQMMEQAVRTARITTEEFYIDRAYYYQEGDNLVVIDPATQWLGYAEIDSTKQIIAQANLGLTSLGVFFLNVATVDDEGNIAKLSQEQLDAFREYYFNFVAAGAQVTVASDDPAIFTATNLYIRYYKTFNLENIKNEIYTALHNIQLTRRTTNRLYINEIETALNNLPGIRDAYFEDPVVQYSNGTEEPEGGSFTLQPGYFNFDPALYDFTLDKTIFEAV